MKIPLAIAELVSEFSGLNRTPGFTPVRSTTPNCQNASTCQTHSKPPDEKYNGARRHSVNITVGADKLPAIVPKPPREPSIELKYRKNRRKSAPCISSNPTSLKEKLSRLRSANSSGDEDDIHDILEEDEGSRKHSTLHGRLVDQ